MFLHNDSEAKRLRLIIGGLTPAQVRVCTAYGALFGSGQ